MKIKVGYLLSYDYSMFLTSVKQLYNHVDKIVVGIDQDYLTWSGNKFSIPQSFFDDIKNFDKRNIIEFYFDKFYISELSPMECESRERNLVLKKLGNGWKIQIDVDEYILNFNLLKSYLEKYKYLTYFPLLTPIVLTAKLITLFKSDEHGFYYINDKLRFPLVTNQNENTFTRWNNSVFSHFINLTVIHQSWAREEKEIRKKVENWGHRDDFDTAEYINFWKSISKNNYDEIKNFHPISPTAWNTLQMIETNSIEGFLQRYNEKVEENLINIPQFSLIHYFVNNSFIRVLKNYLKSLFNYDKNEKLKRIYRKLRRVDTTLYD